MAIDASLDAGVTITGSFDDATASYFGGVVVTDNKNREFIIKEKMDELAKQRKEKQPLEYPNAGSTFKRGEDFITASLIDECGLKGYKIGGAQIYLKREDLVEVVVG